MMRQRKTLPWLLSLSLCLGFVLTTPGCSLLFPNGPAPAPAPAPDDNDKKPDPNDKFNARAGLAAALAKDSVSKAECVLLYGIFAGTADFVSSQTSDTSLNTSDVGHRMEPVMAAVGWESGKYTNVKAEISRVWGALDFKENPKQLSDDAAKKALLMAYRSLAAGAKDAAVTAK